MKQNEQMLEIKLLRGSLGIGDGAGCNAGRGCVEYTGYGGHAYGNEDGYEDGKGSGSGIGYEVGWSDCSGGMDNFRTM